MECPHCGHKFTPPKKVKEKKVFASDSIEYRSAEYLLKMIRVNDSKVRVGKDEETKQSWAATIDKIYRIEKRTPEEFAKVVQFATTDEFWKSNILSAEAVKKQFSRILLKSKATKHGNYKFDPSKYSDSPSRTTGQSDIQPWDRPD